MNAQQRIFRSTLAFGIVCACLQPAPAVAENPPPPGQLSSEAVQTLVNKAWKTVQKPKAVVSLGDKLGPIDYDAPQITPAFPTSWPPSTTTQLVYYGTVYGGCQGLSDASCSFLPFVSVTVSPADVSHPKVQVLTPSLKSYGLRGGLPLPSSMEMQDNVSRLLSTQDAVTTKLYKLCADPTADRKDMSDIRNFYLAYFLNNSEEENQLAPRHQAFFNWLEDPTGKKKHRSDKSNLKRGHK